MYLSFRLKVLQRHKFSDYLHKEEGMSLEGERHPFFFSCSLTKNGLSIVKTAFTTTKEEFSPIESFTLSPPFIFLIFRCILWNIPFFHAQRCFTLYGKIVHLCAQIVQKRFVRKDSVTFTKRRCETSVKDVSFTAFISNSICYGTVKAWNLQRKDGCRGWNIQSCWYRHGLFSNAQITFNQKVAPI